MAAPTFVQASGGAVDTSGGFSDILTSATVGNVVIFQILQDGTSAASSIALAAATSSGIEDLAGTDDATTVIGNFDVGSPVAARQHIWIGRAIDTTVVFGASNSAADDVYFRTYEFAGVNAGTTLSDVIENGSAGATSNTAGTSATIADSGVTTLGAERLALNFVAGNDDNALDAFTGMSGGTWAEAVAEFATATGTDGVIGLQTATLASAGTIDGGTDGWADAADSWGVVGFALKPSAPAVVIPRILMAPMVPAYNRPRY